MMMSYWKAGEEYLEQVAAEYGIPVAQVFDAFHGPDGTSIPCDQGLLQADCLHPAPDGYLLMATLLHDLGYEPAA